MNVMIAVLLMFWTFQKKDEPPSISIRVYSPPGSTWESAEERYCVTYGDFPIFLSCDYDLKLSKQDVRCALDNAGTASSSEVHNACRRQVYGTAMGEAKTFQVRLFQSPLRGPVQPINPWAISKDPTETRWKCSIKEKLIDCEFVTSADQKINDYTLAKFKEAPEAKKTKK